MTTYTLSGFYFASDANDAVSDFRLTTFEFVTAPGVTGLSYSYVEQPNGSGPTNVEIANQGTDIYSSTVDNGFDPDPEDTAVLQLSWTDGGQTRSTTLLRIQLLEPGTGEYLFYLGGDPLPALNSAGGLNDFINNQVTGATDVPASSPFAANTVIPIASLPIASSTENDGFAFKESGFELDLGAGDDAIRDDGGNNTIRGGAGEDVLFTNTQSTYFDGGGEYDELAVVDEGGTEAIFIEFSPSSGAQVAATGRSDHSATPFDYYTVTADNIERVQSQFFGDLLIHGDAADNQIRLNELPAIFDFQGEGGDDTLALHRMWYEDDAGARQRGLSSTYFLDNVDVTGTTSDVTLANNDGTGDIGYLRDVEFIRFTDGTFAVADLLAQSSGGTGTPSENDDTLVGTANGDKINGLGGDDGISGLGGNDILIGGGGSDSVAGDAGNDILMGGDRGLYGTELSGQIYRLFNAVFGREPNWNGHQNWALNLASDAWTLDSISAAFVAGQEFQIRYGPLSNTDFVTQLFLNVLGRPPAEAGVTGWVANIDNGMSRAEVVRRISESGEHKILTREGLAAFEEARDPTEWADDVFRLFRAVFDRDPGEAGFTGWVDNLAEGTFDFSGVVSQFMASQEFQLTYGNTTNQEFVLRIFQNVYGRDPAQAGLDGWTANLDGGMTRETMVEIFVNTPEFLILTGAALESYMAGFGTDDVIAPGAGNDIASGGLFADTFEFTADGVASTVTVTDLEPWDSLDFSDFGLTEQQVLANISQDGADAVYDDGTEVIRFVKTDLADITSDMILV